MTARGMLDGASLEEAIATGEIDTVLVAFPDLQGRLVGKRVTGSYWSEHMGGGTEPLHACNYLLAVDSEMNVLPGYTFASWDQGYGDMAAQPDLATIRKILDPNVRAMHLRNNFVDLADVAATDDFTVTARYKKPYFLAFRALATLVIYPAHLLEKSGDVLHNAWALGIPTEGAKWCTFVVPRPGVNSTAIVDAGRAVTAMLGAVRSREGGRESRVPRRLRTEAEASQYASLPGAL